jgi:calcium permeable stress-gated cation channel
VARRFEPTIPQAEHLTQAWYFAFQLIQVFLITTFSSGAAAVATKIAREPGQVPSLLAENLPKASNFYLTYFILQGTASAAQNILNWSDLAEYIAYDKLFDRTPRDKYERFTWMKGLSWGSVYPKFANFAVIGEYLHLWSCLDPMLRPRSNRIFLHCPTDPWFCHHWYIPLLSQLSVQSPLRDSNED